MAEEKSVLLELNVDISANIKQLQKYQNALDNTNASIKEYQKRQREGTKLTEEEQADLLRLTEQRKALQKEMSNQSRYIQNSIVQNGKYQNTLKGLCAELSKAKDELRAMSLTDPGFQEKTKQVDELNEKIKEMEAAYGSHQRNVGNYEEAILNALGINNKFGQSLMAMSSGSGGGSGFKNMLASMGTSVKAFGKTLLGLLTNPVFLGIAGIAGAGMAFKFWYDYNKGLAEATKLTQQFTGLAGNDMKAVRNEVQAVSDMYGKDFKEVLVSVNALAQQFGISHQEALSIVKDGFVSGADASGQFLDTLREYPAYFKEAGISAEEFVAIATEATKQGIYSDKGVDAIKEANLRIREMTTATSDALKGIGIDSEQVQKDLQSGAKTTFDVIQEVSARLSELPESSAAVGTALADIFGGPGEDAGLQYIKTLKDIETDLDAVKAKSGELGAIQERQLQGQIELDNAVSALFDATGGSFERMTANLKIMANEWLTKIVKYLIDITNSVIGIYNASGLVRGGIQTIIAAVRILYVISRNLSSMVFDSLKGIAKLVEGIFTMDLDKIKEAVQIPIDRVASSVQQVTDIVKDGIDNFNKKIDPIEIPVSTVGDSGPSPAPSGAKPVTSTPALNDEQYEAALKHMQETAKLEQQLLEKQSAYYYNDALSAEENAEKKFQAEQIYQTKLFEMKQRQEKEQLAFQLKNGKLTQQQYDTMLQAMSIGSDKFYRETGEKLAAHNRELLQSAIDLAGGKGVEDQIEDVREAYRSAAEQIKSDATLSAEEKSYYVTQLAMREAEEIKSIRLNANDETNRRIEESVSELYMNDTRQFSRSQQDRLSLDADYLKELISRKKKAGQQTIAEEEALAQTEARIRLANLDSELQQTWNNLDAQYQLRRQYLEKELALEELSAERRAALEQELAQLNSDYANEKIAAFESYSSNVTDTLSSLNDLFNSLGDREVQKAESDNEKKKKSLDKQLKAGVISQEKYDKQTEALDEELDKKKAAIERKAAIRQKALSAMQIAINTAAAIMKIWAEVPKVDFGISTAALTAVAASVGAIQLAAVLAEPLPQARVGGLVQGASHEQGGVLVNTEGGERIVSAAPSRAFPELLNLISYIGKHSSVPDTGFGVSSYPVPAMAGGEMDYERLSDMIADRMSSSLRDLKIYTAITDVREADRNYTTIENSAKI